MLILESLSLMMLGAFIFFVVRILTDRCWHAWGKWEYHENPAAFVNKRTCLLCGKTEVQQTLKLWD